MSRRTARPWPSYLLGALCVGAIIVAYLVVGPPSQGSSGGASRVVTAARGVVQSTVSGSGNIQSSSQLDLGFKTSGVVQRMYVSQGQHVVKGQLIATLNPESAEVTLEQSKASLQAAEASLTEEEENRGQTSSGQSATGSSHAGTGGSQTNSTAGASAQTYSAAGGSAQSNAGQNGARAGGAGEAVADSTSTLSKAAREANIASARAAVKSARLTVQSDEQAVKDTKLYAPETGTIVSLSGEVGETVSARGTTKDTSSTGSSSSGAEGAGRSATGGTGTAGADSSASSSSGSTFAVLSDLSSLQLVVPLSESEIGSVRIGQLATVTVEALEGRKLAAHVTQVSTLPSSESGVVSYDVTFKLDQTIAGLKPGMSATAEVVVKQAEGVNVPSEAITGAAVTVVKNGKQQRQAVLTGLAGNSSTIILSGLNAGERVVLPTATTSSGANILSRLGREAGAGGLGGTGALGGGGAFVRGAAGGGGAGFRGGGIP
jgi:HlyD family secretion protein